MDKSKDTIPRHVGLILDGNRRWAKEQGLPVFKGHSRGLDVLQEISFHAFDAGVNYLSAFIFSTENWKRTQDEVNFLMDLTIKALDTYLSEFDERNIRLVILGRREGVRESVLRAIERAEEATKNNTAGTLALCFNYGGTEELVDAYKKIAASGVATEDITAEILQQNLYHPEVPGIDLLIRTSGEQRLSGFMLYRAAYSELKFIDKFWPDFTATDFDEAIKEYAERERRFGS